LSFLLDGSSTQNDALSDPSLIRGLSSGIIKTTVTKKQRRWQLTYIYFPPIAKSAMDGAPEDGWLIEE